MKVLFIKKCPHCPFHDFDGQMEKRLWGKHYCQHVKIGKPRIAPITIIPKWCPLPNAKQQSGIATEQPITSAVQH